MNVLVIIIVVVTVFVVIRAYALRNDEQRKQVRSEIADRIEERDNLNVEVQPKEEISTCNSLFNRSSSLEEYNFINELGGSIEVEIKGLSYRMLQERQRAKLLRSGENLMLKREYNNPVDKHAVAIYSNDNYQLGYIPANLAEGVSNLLEKKYDLECMVS